MSSTRNYLHKLNGNCILKNKFLLLKTQHDLLGFYKLINF
jgi:hypothetical protein